MVILKQKALNSMYMRDFEKIYQMHFMKKLILLCAPKITLLLKNVLLIYLFVCLSERHNDR